MSLTRLICCLPVLCFAACDAPEAAGPDESQEPPLAYTLQVAGKQVSIKEGETVEVAGNFTNPKVNLTADEHRLFPYQGVQFNYPRTFIFEADLADSASKSWTLSGNDLKIMLFSINKNVTSREFAQNLIDEFGPANARVTNANAKLKLGDQQLTGTTIEVSITAHRMVMDVFSLPNRGRRTRLLVLQDSPDDVGNRSQEAAATLKMLQSSFKLQE